jgi:hypothetical protein
MKRIVAMVLMAALPGVSGAAEFPLKRVVLSTAGLAQFTHSGSINGAGTVELPVRLDQVDDVLKSLTVFDSAGAIGAVSLPGKTPLAEIFRDLPFSRKALESQSALLNALVGADVEIEGNVNAAGRVLRVEEERVQLPNNGGQTVRHRLKLMTPNGFVQAILEDVKVLRFTDPKLKAQIDRALTAIAENRAKDQRTITINLGGQGERQAGFSYVVSAPVWKTAYRLVLPKEGDKARLQGWGVLENLTGGDWKDVELTLVSGNPVALKQPLYSAVFVDRPEIPVSASARIVPRKDDAEDQTLELSLAAAAPLAKSRSRSFHAAAQPPEARGRRKSVDALGGGFGEAPGEPEQHAEAEEAATQVLYRFPSKVTLASGATMMIPFVDSQIGASRIYLYQPETNAVRPLAAIKLRNDGGSALPAGLVTAYETSADGSVNFAGDAQLPLLPKGTTRFITFALDAKTAIRRSDEGIKQIRLGKATGGKLSVTVKSLWTVDYEITPPAGEDREIIIEEPRRTGWKPVGDSKDIEETPTRLRLTVQAPKGKTTKASLRREHLDHESVILSSMAPDRIVAVISGLENQTPALKEAIGKLGGLAAAIAKANAHKRELETEREKIAEDQDRIRRNLASTGSSSDLGRHYLDTLKNQEDRLAAITTEEKAIEQDIAAKMKEAEVVAKALVL